LTLFCQGTAKQHPTNATELPSAEKSNFDRKCLASCTCQDGKMNFITYNLLMEEILPQLISSLSHYLQGFVYPRWCRISSINSMSAPKVFSDLVHSEIVCTTNSDDGIVFEILICLHSSKIKTEIRVSDSH